MEDVEIFAQNIPHPEGVAFGPEGWLYTGSSLPDHKGTGPIYRVSPDGKTVEKFADTGGRVLGLAFDRRGELYVCDSARGAVFRISPEGTVHLFADHVGPRKMQIPNFLVFDQEGNLYVSDSGTARAGEPTGAIFRFTPGGMGKIFLDRLVFANGLALSSQEDTIYVVETRDDRVLRVPITSNRSAGQVDVYADNLTSGPDGLALDAVGNLYITVTRSNQIVCVTTNGKRFSLVADSTDRRVCMPSNLAFGGLDNHELYIANLFSHHISRLTVENAGMPVYSQR